MSSPGSGVTKVAITDASVAPMQPHGLGDFLRRAEHQVIEADGVDAELLGDVDHLVERLEALVRDGRVDADAQRRVLAPRRRLQPAQPGAGPLERALQAARVVVQLAGAVDRDADVLQEAGGARDRRALRRAPR